MEANIKENGIIYKKGNDLEVYSEVSWNKLGKYLYFLFRNNYLFS